MVPRKGAPVPHRATLGGAAISHLAEGGRGIVDKSFVCVKDNSGF